MRRNPVFQRDDFWGDLLNILAAAPVYRQSLPKEHLEGKISPPALVHLIDYELSFLPPERSKGEYLFDKGYLNPSLYK